MKEVDSFILVGDTLVTHARYRYRLSITDLYLKHHTRRERTWNAYTMIIYTTLRIRNFPDVILYVLPEKCLPRLLIDSYRKLLWFLQTVKHIFEGINSSCTRDHLVYGPSDLCRTCGSHRNNYSKSLRIKTRWVR